MNKKILIYGIVGFFALALVSAALVSYYAQREVDMNIQSPLTLYGSQLTSVNLTAGEGYQLYLERGVNKLSHPLKVDAKFILEDGNGNVITDTTGFNLAYTGDTEYYFNSSAGGCNGPTTTGCGPSFSGQTWKEWMLQFPNWLDWALNGAYSKFNSTIITNDGGTSVAINAIAFNTNIPLTLKSGNFDGVVYLSEDSAVVPGNYKLKMQMIPN